MAFVRAERKRVFLRLACLGPAGSGKTYTSLALADRLAKQFGAKIALIDTEHGSASKYADKWAFDTCELADFAVENYITAIAEAERAGYGVLVIDSLSHAWAGKGGLLEFVDKTAKRQKSGNSFAAWGEATPKQQNLIEAMLSYRGHLIVTMRTKMEYVQEKDANGRTTIRKIGLQPVQRDGLEYEFDIVADMDQDHNLVVAKTRFSDIADAVYARPDEQFFGPVVRWIEGSASAPEPELRQPESRPVRRSDQDKARAGEKAYLELFAPGERDVAADKLLEAKRGILRIPLTGEPTEGIEEASPGTLMKYVTFLAAAFNTEKRAREQQERKARKVKNQPPDVTAGEVNRMG